MTPRVTTYWITWVATLLFFAAFYTLLVPLPLYLAGVGFRDWQVALVLGAFGVASLAARPLAGIVTDMWGARQVMMLGAGSLVAGAIGVPFATGVAPLFALRILQAAGYVGFTTASTALIASLAPARERGSALAMFGVAANVAMTLTPVAIGASLNLLTLTGAFALSACAAALAGALCLRLPGERAGGNPPAWGALTRLPRDLVAPMLAAALFGVGFGAFLQFLPLLAARRALGSPGLGYAAYGAGIITTRLLTRGLQDRVDRSAILFPAFVSLAAGLTGLAFAGRAPALVAAAVLVSGGSGILHPALIAAHVERRPPAERGRATSVFYLGFDLGIGLGAWALSPFFQRWDVAGLYLAAAAFAACGLLLVRAVARHNDKWTMIK